MVKANPSEYVGRPITLTGLARISDYFNYGYRNAQKTHYSILFQQATKDLDVGGRCDGEMCHLYLSRENGREIADRIAATAPKNIRMRALASITRKDSLSNNPNWDMLELLAVQFQDNEGKWGDWIEAAKKR